MYELLDRINVPSDIKGFTMTQLARLCVEIRDYMVHVCAVNPGHLGSSLGAVELIVGLHYVFDTPSDKVVFDVGHQSYAHKILTGRKEAFRNLRAGDGPSGFPKMEESEYDAFGVGHSSTSISAALGLAEAARISGRREKVAAFIGDGSLTGGLAFEGLNNAGDSSADLLVILNDNDHSIDDNRGSLHRYLLRITTSSRYNRIKGRVWNMLGEGRFRDSMQNWIRSLKSWFVKKSGGDFFEALGFRYFGPIDGNDISQVVTALRKLYNIRGPRLLHAITVKGKGYPAAEANPTVWHAPGKFNPETGERIVSKYEADRYQDVFGAVLCELADADDRIVGVTPAMASGCGMNRLAEHKPSRFFDVGIEEEHAVTFSAGLAAGGLRPVCNIYSAFSQRAYDQIIHDVALQKLPVVFCFDRAGLVGEDGATHNGAFDLAAYRSIPGMVIAAPSDEVELKQMMYTAVHYDGGPFIIRYPRGLGEGADWKNAPYAQVAVGKGRELLKGSRTAVLALGPAANRALEVAGRFNGQAGVYDLRFLKPLDDALMEMISTSYESVLTVEDGCLKGGLFGAVCEWMAERGSTMRISAAGIPDSFITHARQSDQRRACGIDADGIASRLEKMLG